MMLIVNLGQNIINLVSEYYEFSNLFKKYTCSWAAGLLSG